MTDFLMEIAQRPQARKLVKVLGLPIPVPPILKRPRGPRDVRPFEGLEIGAYLTEGSPVTGAIALTLAEAGGGVWSHEHVPAALRDAAEAFGRPAGVIDPEGKRRFGALVFDGTAIDSSDGLAALHAFFHPIVRRMRSGARVAVLSRPIDAVSSPEAAGAQAALEGFVRSLSKELGRKGGAATLLEVAPGSEPRLKGPLRFALSSRAAYISGQPIRVGDAVKSAEADGSWASPLSGKRALVTGGARGIGKATARILAAEGARVIILDRPEDRGQAAPLARELGGEVLGIDLGDPTAPDAVADALSDGIDIVIHNAGVTRDKTLGRMKPSLWDLTLAVNLRAVIQVTEQLVSRDLIRDGGRIVCLSSVSGIAGNVGQTNYGASKSGVIGYVRTMSGPLGARGIAINAVAPGFIETRMTDAMPVAIREVARRMNSLGQGGQPADVGEAVAFLSLPSSVGITGQVLRVCGGALIGA
jgi:3-oxoacyl-[acyl-carrier protein] reductase